MQAEALGGGEVVYSPPAHLEEEEGEDQDEKGAAGEALPLAHVKIEQIA